MAAAALAFHREIEAAVESNSTLPGYASGGYEVVPVVGIAQETLQSARLAGGKVEMLKTYDGEDLGGDGTVPRVSAIPIEMSDRADDAMYAGTKHGSLQNADAVIRHLTGVLTGLNIDLGGFRHMAAPVALEVEDVVAADEPVEVRARPSQDDASLTATVWAGGRADPVATEPLAPADDGWQRATFGPLPDGAYRVVVSGEDVQQAEDAFAVVDFTGAEQ
jgi:hypothetical protein